MARFFLAFKGGKMPKTPEQGEKLMTAWTAWMEGLGAALVEPGNPVGKSKTVSADGVADNGGPAPLTGYSIVEAETIEAAVAMAQKSPHLDGGTIEIAEIIKM